MKTYLTLTNMATIVSVQVTKYFLIVFLTVWRIYSCFQIVYKLYLSFLSSFVVLVS